ncbi:MAG: dephospho-CoA kinase [Rickettsiales bacterium]
MIILGLTGSIGMGKTTVTEQFASLGAATSNADTIVHGLLTADEEVITQIGERFPEAVGKGGVNRQKLGDLVFGNAQHIKWLERILHPKVKAAEVAFAQAAEAAGRWLVVMDIPLLFETGAEKRMDYTAVVSAPYEVQRERVLARAGMTEEKFEAILALQVPDEEKRRRADFVIPTDQGMDASLAVVKTIMDTLKLKEQKRNEG